MMMNKLLPCPFCGKWWLSHYLEKETRMMGIQCQDCGAFGPGVSVLSTVEPFDVSEKIIKAQELWNTRAVVDNA